MENRSSSGNSQRSGSGSQSQGWQKQDESIKKAGMRPEDGSSGQSWQREDSGSKRGASGSSEPDRLKETDRTGGQQFGQSGESRRSGQSMESDRSK
jgi:hypothetical protein